MSNLVYIFLDVDGVLNNERYIISCYEKHHKPMHMNHVPFDPRCLNNLMILVQSLEKLKFEVKIILSSTWRLHDIDYEIVNARIAEYGLKLYGKTPNINQNRGVEIKDFLQDKKYYSFIILDDDIFDIQDIYPQNLIKINGRIGLTKRDVQKALNIIYLERRIYDARDGDLESSK